MRFYAFCLLFFILCSVSLPVYGAVIGKTNEEVSAIANPILDNVIAGFADDNYAQYAKDFDATLKETITAERFQEIREDILKWIGSYLYREYLGFLNKEAITIVFWKGVFDKSEDDILIKMVISERNGKYLITGLWYQ